MSRTDKDKPLHVRAVWWEPTHWRCEQATSRRWENWPTSRPCNLPAEPDPAGYDRTLRYGSRADARCTWEPVWDRRRYGRGSAPSWYVSLVWTDPQRAVIRDYVRVVRAEYRATGDVDDTVEPDGRTRNSASWDYW